MEWTHLVCMAAGGLLGSFLMTVWSNERMYKRQREYEIYRTHYMRTRWFPPAASEPPPALQKKVGGYQPMTVDGVISHPPSRR